MLYPTRRDQHSLLRRGLKLGHLRLLAVLGEGRPLTVAAQDVGISQPAASRMMAEIEGVVGQAVHERSGRGIEMTPVGLALARRARRVLIELDDAARDLNEITAGGAGHVRLGTVTGAAIDRVMPALLAQRRAFPGVQFEMVVAASDALCEQLLDGRLDFALGRLPDRSLDDELSYRALDSEPVALVVRQGHPALADCRPEVVMALDWVIPPGESLIARTVMSRLQVLGLPRPRVPIATASFMMTMALIGATDAVAALPASVIGSFATPGSDYRQLPLDLGITVEHFGMIVRRDVVLPPAARRIADLIQLGA